jgi:hypothetical protein
MDDFFSPPAFKPDEALTKLKRSLRELGLTERGAGFELKAKPVVQLATQTQSIEIKLAKQPAISPIWENRSLKSHADIRKLTDDLKLRLARWADAE